MDGSEGARVLIVGAGPVGLFLAAELLRHGIRPRIVERRTEPGAYSRALAIQPRSLEVMAPSGLTRRLLRHGLQTHRTRIVAGAQQIDASFDELGSEHPYVLILPQSDTERELEAHLQEHGVLVERGVELVMVDQEESHVDVTLRGEHLMQEPFDWVIGCDGAHSLVRQQAGIDWAGDELALRFVIADLELDWTGARDETALFLGRSGLCALFPLPGGPRSWRVIADLPESEVPEASAASVTRILKERTGRTTVAGRVHTVQILHTSERIAASYRQGRVLLAGDSAHVYSPVDGQGMNTGLQDVHNLAWKLALVVRSGAPPSLLDSYGAERRPIAERVLWDTQLATRLATARGTLVSAIRSQVVGIVAGLHDVQHRAIERGTEVDTSYRRSPIVTHAGGTALLHAGDHVPDLRWGPQTSLSRLGGTHHLALLFDGGAEPEQPRLLDLAIELEARFPGLLRAWVVLGAGDRPESIPRGAPYLLDPGGMLHHGLSVEGCAALVIRPDGYLGYAGPAEGPPLHEHLARVLGEPAV